MLDLRYFPSRWKTAVIVPILKPGLDASLPVSYRPISLLSALSKLFEFVLLNRLKEFCQTNAILIDEQFGFRPKLSTQHQLLRVTEFFHEAVRRSQTCGAIFLDVAKAFDRVWQTGLIYKLISIGLPAQLIHLTHSYLSNRFFKVRVDSILSDPLLIEAGIPQGSLLGPFLFNLYVNDIPKLNDITLALYADDTAVLSSHRTFDGLYENLQNYLMLLERWFLIWRIKINASKSAFLPVTRRRDIPHYDLLIFGEPIPWVQNYKYLGVIFDTKLIWREQITAARGKALAARAQLRPFLARKSHLTVNNKLLLYKTVLRPIFTYGSVVWGSAAWTHIKKLQVFQNRTLREIIDMPYYVRCAVIHSDLKILPVLHFIKKNASRFFSKLPLVPIATLHEIENYSLFDPVNRRRPRALLDPDTRPAFPAPKRLRLV